MNVEILMGVQAQEWVNCSMGIFCSLPSLLFHVLVEYKQEAIFSTYTQKLASWF